MVVAEHSNRHTRREAGSQSQESLEGDRPVAEGAYSFVLRDVQRRVHLDDRLLPYAVRNTT